MALFILNFKIICHKKLEKVQISMVNIITDLPVEVLEYTRSVAASWIAITIMIIILQSLPIPTAIKTSTIEI